MGNNEQALQRAIELLGDKWTLILLRDLLGHDGPIRFRDFLSSTITPSILVVRLRNLERDSFLTRTSYGPQHVEYALTEQGKDVASVILALRNFGKQWLI